MTRLHFLIKGDVQGVGYRWFVREKASELKLAGWVKNRADGAVEAEAEGDAEALKRFERILRTGHPYARVDAIEAKSLKALGGAAAFDIVC